MQPLIANGKQVDVEFPCTLEEFLLSRNLPPRSVVVEHNEQAVAPSDFPRRQLNPGDHLEIQDLGNGRLLVTGSARLDEIGEILDLDLESEGLDTIGGLLFNAVDRLPDPGEKIVLDGIVATVLRCSSRRIEEALIQSEQ